MYKYTHLTLSVKTLLLIQNILIYEYVILVYNNGDIHHEPFLCNPLFPNNIFSYIKSYLVYCIEKANLLMPWMIFNTFNWANKVYLQNCLWPISWKYSKTWTIALFLNRGTELSTVYFVLIQNKQKDV